VFSIGNEIAHVYGLNKIQATKMVEFVSGVKGMALNFKNENVGIIIFGSDTTIKEGDIVKHIRSIVEHNCYVPQVNYLPKMQIIGNEVGSLGVNVMKRVEDSVKKGKKGSFLFYFSFKLF